MDAKNMNVEDTTKTPWSLTITINKKTLLIAGAALAGVALAYVGAKVVSESEVLEDALEVPEALTQDA